MHGGAIRARQLALAAHDQGDLERSPPAVRGGWDASACSVDGARHAPPPMFLKNARPSIGRPVAKVIVLARTRQAFARCLEFQQALYPATFIGITGALCDRRAEGEHVRRQAP
ncbi:MAG: hypothetical protein ABIS17_04985 [Casimicrobiaceae bacterium]